MTKVSRFRYRLSREQVDRIFVLREEHGLTHALIAERMGVSVGTVATILRNGKRDDPRRRSGGRD